MDKGFSILNERLLKNLILWAKESYLRTLLVFLTLLIIGIPLIQYLQNEVKKIPTLLLSVSNTVVTFANNNLSIPDYFFLITIIALFFIILVIYKKLEKTKIITDSFNRQLNGWAIPLGSGWTIQPCTDALGYMLSVTNSIFPGILKEAFGWYDYEITFLTKINSKVKAGRQNFSVIVRSENNFNGVMLQVTSTHLRPHLLYNGTYILDTEKDEQLPTVLPSSVWIPVKILVVGNNIDLWIYNHKLNYKIPTKIYDVENTLLTSGQTLTINKLEESKRKIENRWMKLVEINKMPSSQNKFSEQDKLVKDLTDNPSSKVLLEFQKGSVGFREWGEEHAYFRNLKVKKI